jgi:hypothetical protein
MTEVVDRMKAEVERRFEHLNTINNQFSFMSLAVLLDSKQASYIEEKIKDLVHTYDELNASELYQEVGRLPHLVEVLNTKESGAKTERGGRNYA